MNRFPLKGMFLNKLPKCGSTSCQQKMFLCLHVSDVTKDRVVLLYAIVTERSINIRQVINHAILHTSSTKRVGLWFLSLITITCKRAGVQWDSNEELLHSKVLIDVRLLFHYLQPSTSGSSLCAPCPQAPQPRPRTLTLPQRIE